jgi:anaerobic selenocysteine-containing dehydrogenase
MMTVPDVANRLKALRARGGKLVVIDPRRTETAEIADTHLFIRPGTDAAFLAAFINVLREENLFRITSPEKLNGLEAVLDALKGITAEAVAEHVGIAATDIRALARAFCAAPRAVAYGRMGTTTQTFGATNQWLIYLINIVSGNLDRVGGALPTQPLLPITGPGTRAGSFGRWRSRVRQLPEVNGELPVSALAEEMLTPGEGQIRALLTIAGNPVLSTPGGRKLEQALSSLSFMVSIDIFINETTRFANLILPPASSLSHDHYDSVFNAFAVRNVTRFNGAIWPRGDDERYDLEIAQGIGTRLAARLGREYRPAPRVHEVAAHACAQSGKLTPQALLAASHGIDLGPLQPSLMSRLQTPDGMIQCAPPLLLTDVARIKANIANAPAAMQLIGRRHVRSNNSWMHQIHRLTKGKPRHQALMHPDDMRERGITNGARIVVRSAADQVELEVAESADMMRGVVSIPHGFGHQRDGFSLPGAVVGASINDVTDPALIDPVSANSVLNGVPVSVSLAPAT